MSELIGRKLGQYEITGLLGEGGIATVYRAHQTSIGRDVAIKIIESKLARSPEFIRRFEREANTIAALDHPHILKIYGFGREDDLLYLVMELKSGGSLTQAIRAGRIAPDRVAHYLNQIAIALDYAHSRGVIHRDLKPQNVLLDQDGNVFLTDFGIAKLVDETTALTHSGMAMGTPAYMSPEQCQGAAVDARSNLYALGVMLFEMLTGQVPFRADTPVGMAMLHIGQTPPSVRELRGELPESVVRVVHKALAKRPEDRFQTAGALATAFRVVMQGEIDQLIAEVNSSKKRQLPIRANVLIASVANLAFIVTVLIGILFGMPSWNDQQAATQTAKAATQIALASSLTPSATPEHDIPIVIRSLSGDEIGNGHLRVFTPTSVSYPETTRVELFLVFDSYYITPTPFGPRTVFPVTTITPGSIAPRSTTTPRLPIFEGVPQSVEFYPLMGASLRCLSNSFHGCDQNHDLITAHRIGLDGAKWEWIISPTENSLGQQDIRLELWKLISINGDERVDVVWDYSFELSVLPKNEGWSQALLATFRENLGAIIAATGAILVALIGAGVIFKKRSSANERSTKRKGRATLGH